MQPSPIHAVVAFDFSTSSSHALARAVDVACRAPDHVLHIVTVAESATFETTEKMRAMLLHHATTSFEGRCAPEVQFYIHVRIGKPADEILDLASEVGAQMIFIGSHGRTGVARMLLGSVSERVVANARCSVIVAKEATYPEVVLHPVTYFEHERTPHREPHVYSYSQARGITRPDEWPIP